MMKIRILLVGIAIVVFSFTCPAQMRRPSVASQQFIVKTKQQIDDIERDLARQSGNKAQDIVPQVGIQSRIAVFHDEKRVDDMVELHDGSDDVYYVLGGTATLLLGGTLDDPREVSPGEWRSKTATGSTKVVIKKGDLVFVPRGTPHQRTVTGKGFSMILVKVFADRQPVK
jgi:mannose-6-phosphate isomerase-like protein (cupin superfamily)